VARGEFSGLITHPTLVTPPERQAAKMLPAIADTSPTVKI